MSPCSLAALRKKVSKLAPALDGRVEEHQRFMLGMQLRRLDQVETDLTALDARIDAMLASYRVEFERLQQIPGVDHIVAATSVVEFGVDMTVFASHHHAAAWAGVCPGSRQSAGRKKRDLCVKAM